MIILIKQICEGGEGDLESRSVSVAWKIMMIPDFAALLFGLVFAFAPGVMNSAGYESFTGQSWSTFVSVSPKIAEWISLWLMGFGVFSIDLSVYGFAVTLMSFRRRERWSWYALLIGNTLSWIFSVGLTYILGEIPQAIISVVMLLIAYIALAIAAKDILSKK